jgi:hypothetical protein
MTERLSHYAPKSKDKAPLDLRADLAPVVTRIKEVLPSKIIWKLFSSSKNETGGRVVFPYFRVDKTLMTVDTCLYLLRDDNRREKKKRYQLACEMAFGVLVWVEIGFEGLENLAKDKASVNWTGGVGHFVDDEERAVGIMSSGRSDYERVLKAFVSYRSKAGIKRDYFSKYKVEYLLDKFK